MSAIENPIPGGSSTTSPSVMMRVMIASPPRA
jgi:hypothetical protein